MAKSPCSTNSLLPSHKTNCRRRHRSGDVQLPPPSHASSNRMHQRKATFNSLTDPPPFPKSPIPIIVSSTTTTTTYHVGSWLRLRNHDHPPGPSYTHMVSSPTFSPPPTRHAKAGKPVLKARRAAIEASTQSSAPETTASRKKIARLQRIEAEVGACTARIKALKVESGIIRSEMCPRTREFCRKTRVGGCLEEFDRFNFR